VSAQILARFVTATQLEDLPADVVDRAKLHLLDTLGAGLAGSTAVETLAVVTGGAPTAGSAGVWGTELALRRTTARAGTPPAPAGPSARRQRRPACSDSTRRGAPS
jgi:2-methylcitrate dehydratase PrpD